MGIADVHVRATCYWLNRRVLGNIEATNATRSQGWADYSGIHLDTNIPRDVVTLSWINVGLAQARPNNKSI